MPGSPNLTALKQDDFIILFHRFIHQPSLFDSQYQSVFFTCQDIGFFIAVAQCGARPVAIGIFLCASIMQSLWFIWPAFAVIWLD